VSADEMVFEEVSYREPRRLRRPDRDPRWASQAYELPGPEDLPIFLDRGPADSIERHAISDTSVELGGILLGHECVDEETGRPFVWITRSLEARHYENTQASFTYTHDSWQEITRERDEKFPELDIVGWYHTHPDFGIFLSSHDLFIHQHFFNRPLQVAYVVDPIRHDRGFFQWRDDQIDQLGGFFVTCERAERVATARFLNDLEDLPQTDAGGSGLSPRLEAELIAMLSRPHVSAPAASSTAERLQLATLFAMLGTAFGMVAVAAGLWLYNLNQNVVNQAAEVQKLREGLEVAKEKQRDDLTRARVEAKERALDSLLREIRPGSSPEAFTDLYAKTLRERDEAQRKLADHQALVEDAGRSLNRLQQETKTLREEKDAAVKRVEGLEKSAGQVADLKEDKKDLETKLKALQAKSEEQAAELEVRKDIETGTLPRKYMIAWYTALAGWGVAIMAGLGVLSLTGRSPDGDGAKPHREDALGA
jgi:proteasome lid subunit RPN8/RPN11